MSYDDSHLGSRTSEIQSYTKYTSLENYNVEAKIPKPYVESTSEPSQLSSPQFHITKIGASVRSSYKVFSPSFWQMQQGKSIFQQLWRVGLEQLRREVYDVNWKNFIGQKNL